MKKLYLIFGLSGVLLLASCINDISFQSFRDPDFFSRTYKKLAVKSTIGDLQDIETLEFFLSNEIRSCGTFADKAVKLIPPTREWRDDDALSYLRDNQYDGLIVLETTDEGTYTKFIPATQTVQTTTTKTEKEKKEHNYQYDGRNHDKPKDKEVKEIQTTSVTETPAHTETYNVASVIIKLIDIKSGKTAWICHARRENGQFYISDLYNANFIRTFSEKLTDVLIKDQIIYYREQR